MTSFAQFSRWTRQLLFAGSLMLGCGNPIPLPSEESGCVSPSCAEDSPQEPSVQEPERICPEGKDGDAYWRLPTGELGELAEDCTAEQLCLGGLCAKLGTFAFVSDKNGEAEIYLQEGFLAPLQITSTLPGVSPQSPDFCPENVLLFELMQGYFSELYLIDSSGSVNRVTSAPGYNHDPSCDTAGEWVYFSSNMSGTYNLYKIKPAEGPQSLTRLTHLPEIGDEGLIAVLEPDVCMVGDWVVLRCDYKDGESENSEICKVGTDGTDFTRLTHSEHEGDHAPACSPDGTKIAFASSRYDADLEQGNEDIYVISIDGNNEQRITREAAPELIPAFSSDGKLIGYKKYVERNGNYFTDLWITDVNGKEQMQLTSDPGNEYDITWKP